MRIIGNLLWWLFGGLEAAIGYFIGSLALACTIIGSPDISRGKVFLFYRKFIPLHHEQSRTISISTVDSAIRDTFKF